jgi:hypothetical protein
LRKAAAALLVVLAPLVASVVWLVGAIIRSKIVFGNDDRFSLTFSDVFSDPAGALKMIVAGWIIGFIVTCFIGLPVGFLTAFALRKLRAESGPLYAVGGALEGMLVVFGWFALEYATEGFPQFWTLFSFEEFGASGAVTGLILGLGYWHFVRKPTTVSLA